MSTPTIAHEGNPRVTDALVVSGTLDGTATLLIQFPEEGRPLPPPPNNDESYIISPSNPHKYVWSEEDSGAGTHKFSFGNGRGNVPEIVAAHNITPTTIIPLGGFKDYSKFDGTDVWGLVKRPSTSEFLNEQIGSAGQLLQGIDFGQFINLYWNSTAADPVVNGKAPTGILGCFGRLTETTGTPVSGPAVGVAPGSTYDDFTGYVLAYDQVGARLVLAHYNHQSLFSIPNVLATSASVPAIGQYLVFRYTTRDVNGAVPASLDWFIYSAAGAQVATNTYFNGIDFTFPATEANLAINKWAAFVNIASGNLGSINANDSSTWDTVATGMGFAASGRI